MGHVPGDTGNLSTLEYLEAISQAFDYRVRNYGETAAGVLWKNDHGQKLRFEILTGLLDAEPSSGAISINDFGCGYGAFYDFLQGLPQMPDMNYMGFDISPEMIRLAEPRSAIGKAAFALSPLATRDADYTFVSGTFNLRLDAPDEPWNDFIKSSLAHLWSKTTKGLAFNMLATDHRNKQDGLYYADEMAFLDFCKGFSEDVTLIDDYPLDEWTIFIRRCPRP